MCYKMYVLNNKEIEIELSYKNAVSNKTHQGRINCHTPQVSIASFLIKVLLVLEYELFHFTGTRYSLSSYFCHCFVDVSNYFHIFTNYV